MRWSFDSTAQLAFLPISGFKSRVNFSLKFLNTSENKLALKKTSMLSLLFWRGDPWVLSSDLGILGWLPLGFLKSLFCTRGEMFALVFPSLSRPGWNSIFQKKLTRIRVCVHLYLLLSHENECLAQLLVIVLSLCGHSSIFMLLTKLELSCEELSNHFLLVQAHHVTLGWSDLQEKFVFTDMMN